MRFFARLMMWLVRLPGSEGPGEVFSGAQAVSAGGADGDFDEV